LKVVLFFIITLFTSVLAGCEQKIDKVTTNTDTKPVDDRYDRNKVDPVRIKLGRQLFLKNCTVCHGFNAEGAADWRQRDKDGKYPAPPLNGTGHAWHHPQKALIYTIKNGTAALGGNMPGWKDRLSDHEIESIIFWFQSQWPDELYQAWARRDRESLAK
jgi:mono/diheme cytochrome c family protein